MACTFGPEKPDDEEEEHPADDSESCADCSNWICCMDADALVRVKDKLFCTTRCYGSWLMAQPVERRNPTVTNKMIDSITVYIPEYERVLANVKSEDDKIAVVLTAGDWRRIAQELREDADGQGLGPAENAILEHDGEDDRWATEEQVLRARTKDGQDVACHDCAAATERCAIVIEETLERYELGWDL
jgi:hypothetical protein